jgi:hypothetical protein
MMKRTTMRMKRLNKMISLSKRLKRLEKNNKREKEIHKFPRQLKTNSYLTKMKR